MLLYVGEQSIQHHAPAPLDAGRRTVLGLEQHGEIGRQVVAPQDHGGVVLNHDRNRKSSQPFRAVAHDEHVCTAKPTQIDAI
jgi:hypothetical protein